MSLERILGACIFIAGIVGGAIETFTPFQTWVVACAGTALFVLIEIAERIERAGRK